MTHLGGEVPWEVQRREGFVWRREGGICLAASIFWSAPGPFPVGPRPTRGVGTWLMVLRTGAQDALRLAVSQLSRGRRGEPVLTEAVGTVSS